MENDHLFGMLEASTSSARMAEDKLRMLLEGDSPAPTEATDGVQLGCKAMASRLTGVMERIVIALGELEARIGGRV